MAPKKAIKIPQFKFGIPITENEQNAIKNIIYTTPAYWSEFHCHFRWSALSFNVHWY